MKINKLSRRNFLKKIGLAGVVGLGISGCGDDEKYHFNGIIDGEQIKFYERGIAAEYLEVIRKDGTKILYYNVGCGKIKPDYLIITKDGKGMRYSINDEIGKPILEEAQKQYEDYLEKILKYKKKEGLDLIRK